MLANDSMLFSKKTKKVFDNVPVVVAVSWVDAVVPLVLAVVSLVVETVLDAMDVADVLVVWLVLVPRDEVVVWIVDDVKGVKTVGTVVVADADVVEVVPAVGLVVVLSDSVVGAAVVV